jgi:hypothetical protein
VRVFALFAFLTNTSFEVRTQGKLVVNDTVISGSDFGDGLEERSNKGVLFFLLLLGILGGTLSLFSSFSASLNLMEC